MTDPSTAKVSAATSVVISTVAPQFAGSDDLSYEYTLEHWLEVRAMVSEAEEERGDRANLAGHRQ